MSFFLLVILCASCDKKEMLIETCLLVREGEVKKVIKNIDEEPTLLNMIEKDDNTGLYVYNLLLASVLSENKQVFDYLLLKSVDVNQKSYSPEEYYIAFSCATIQDPYYLIQIIEGGFDPSTTTETEKSMIHYALEYSCLENANVILSKIDNTHKWQTCANEKALIFSAIDSGSVEAVQYVDQHGFPLDCKQPDGIGPVEYIFMQNDSYLKQNEMVLYFLKNYPQTIKAHSLAQKTFINEWDNPALLITIQTNGYDVLNEKDIRGDSVLTYLLETRNFSVIKGFLQFGLKLTDFNHLNMSLDEYLTQVANYTITEKKQFYSFMNGL